MERRKNLALRYCFVAWASLLRWILLIVAVGFLATMALTRDNTWLIVAASLVGGAILATLIYFIESPGVRCLMCGANLLRRLTCVPHGNARKLLGSYSLRSTAKLGTYPALMDCPYCDGHFRLASGKGEGNFRQRRHMTAGGRSRRRSEGLPAATSSSSRMRSSRR